MRRAMLHRTITGAKSLAGRRKRSRRPAGQGERTVKRGARTIFGGVALLCLALVAVLIGAQCVRAAVAGGAVLEDSSSPMSLVAAELDPSFVQKLADRMRAPYLRSLFLSAPRD